MLLPLLLFACTHAVTTDESGVGGETGDTGPRYTVSGEVAVGDVQECANPQASVSYTEVGAAMGIAVDPHYTGQDHEGGSLAVLDVDQDGDLDFAVVFPTDGFLYRRVDDHFEVEALDGVLQPMLVSLTALNEDEHLDLLIAGQRPLTLLGDGVGFAAPGAVATLVDPISAKNGTKLLAPGDLDLDGYNDAFAVVNGTAEPPERQSLADFVLWGDGSGSLNIDPDAVPATGERRGFEAQVFEWQGQRAMYVVNDMGAQFGGNVLYTIEDRAFVDQSAACFCGIEQSAMGLDIADWNGDGLADIYVAATPRNTLLTAQPDGSFVDQALATNSGGVRDEASGMTWGAGFFDYDNDGDLDILDAQGGLFDERIPEEVLRAQPIWLLSQEDGMFVEVGEALGLAQAGSYRSLAAEDFNGDGVPDLLVTALSEPSHLYLSDGCTANGWIDVAAPIDSRVEVTAGGVTHTAWAQTHFGYGGARRPIAHIGLGDQQTVERIVVTTPMGEVMGLEGTLEARRQVVFGTVPGVTRSAVTRSE